MATFPTVVCRAAFGQSFTNGSPTWTDISAYFRRASTRRGRSRLQRTNAQFGAGTATIALDNTDRRFDPTNTASPYWPNVQPGVLINLRATWSGTTYDLFTGYVDNWPVRWPGRAEAETEVSVTDLFGILAKRLIVNAGYGDVVLTDAPNGYWRLDEPAGSTVARDSSGNGYDGTPNTVTFGDAGLLQSSTATAAGFAGAGFGTQTGSVALPSAAGIVGTGDCTFEFWIKASSVATTGTLFVQHPTADGLVIIMGAGGLIQAQSRGTAIATTSTNVLADLQTHHIVLTLSGLSSLLYVDGVLDSSATMAAHPNFSANSVAIGNPPPFAAPFAGDMAHFAIYDTVLSAARVAAHYKAGTPFVQQTTGARVNAVLDAIGFPANMRRVNTGHTTVPLETRSLATTTSLAYMQACETAEQGQLLIGPDGYVEFHDRYDRYNGGSATSQATFGDGAGELGIPVGAFNLDYDTAELFNTVPATRTGGTTQVATATTTTTRTGTDQIGERTAPGLSDVMLTTDQDALSLAQWILADTKQPYYRLDSLNLNPCGDANLWPHVLGRVINDVITANKHTVPGGGAPISLPSRIEGVDQTFGDLKWQTVLHLSQMGAASGWFILDDPTSGTLNGTNRLGW